MQNRSSRRSRHRLKLKNLFAKTGVGTAENGRRQVRNKSGFASSNQRSFLSLPRKCVRTVVFGCFFCWAPFRLIKDLSSAGVISPIRLNSAAYFSGDAIFHLLVRCSITEIVRVALVKSSGPGAAIAVSNLFSPPIVFGEVVDSSAACLKKCQSLKLPCHEEDPCLETGWQNPRGNRVDPLMFAKTGS